MARLPEITLVGHPFAPIGMGENVRSAFRAWNAVYVPARVHDIYRLNTSDPDVANELDGHLTKTLSSEIQIFHINGDEVAQALAHLEPRVSKRGKRIICPAWELPRYPQVWAKELERFDEVWAQSRYTYECLSRAVSIPVLHMSEACEVRISSFLSRRYFGIPDSSYVFLFFFDFASFIERKNPFAGLAAFEKFLERNPFAAATFVVKINGSDKNPEKLKEFTDLIARFPANVHVIDRVMSENEIKNLVRCADCFVSLHRAEGFGHGISEAMVLGKPVIATGYSGNMDFMAPSNALHVDYRLIPVAEDSYPHWHDQVWADPDVDQASRHMDALYRDPELGRTLGRQAKRDMQRSCGYASVGLRYRHRVEALLA